GLAVKREENLIRLYSNNFENIGMITFDLDHLDFDKEHDWANYPKGVIKYLVEAFSVIKQGFDILIEGNIPNGASLSSSASIELLIGWLIKQLFNLNLERL
ncbi:galactokinase, partial [bacterium M00.F.Ca.ET.177.01.1.1]